MDREWRSRSDGTTNPTAAPLGKPPVSLRHPVRRLPRRLLLGVGRIYATKMTSSDRLVATLRADAGLSQRALAARAGCTRSTIVRIESGEMDPTMTMLARIAAATGRRLMVGTDNYEHARSIAAIAASSSNKTDPAIPWTRLRALLDWLNAHPNHTAEAIADPPTRTGSPRLDNLLAGIAEKVADDTSVPRPTWTQAVKPLDQAWQSPGTARMQSREAATAPSQFVERGIFLGAQNLWRQHA